LAVRLSREPARRGAVASAIVRSGGSERMSGREAWMFMALTLSLFTDQAPAKGVATGPVRLELRFMEQRC
jgi:hypothetical protein